MIYFVFFFFSSRRRHTRSLCDWSSDVCSSDLDHGGLDLLRQRGSLTVRPRLPWSLQHYRASRERAPSATNVAGAENAANCRSSTPTPGLQVGGLGHCTARAEA